PPDGAADHGTELVPSEVRLGQARTIGEEPVGVEGAVTEKVVGGAGQLVAAGPGDDCHHAARGSAVLGREGVGLYLEFLGGVYRRDVGHEGAIAGRVGGAVEKDVLRLGPSARDLEVGFEEAAA